jgi:hypothetical protein
MRVQLRSTRRLLRARHYHSGPRLIHRTLARTALPTRGVTYGMVPIPLLFLQNDANLCELPSSIRPRTTQPGSMHMHDDQPQKETLVRRKDSTLRRRISIIRGYIGGSTHLSLTPWHANGPSRHFPPPNQRFLGTNARQPPHGNRHRHSVMILLPSGVTSQKLLTQAQQLIGRSTRNARSFPVKDLLSLADQAHSLFLAITTT